MRGLIFHTATQQPHRRALVLLALLFACVALPRSADAARDNDEALQLLGEQIFLDASLSRNGTVSCASCHQPTAAFADQKQRAIGYHGKIGTRNTPSLLSLSGSQYLWDGQAPLLEDAVLHAVANPAQMGWQSYAPLLHRIHRNPYYRVAFRQANPYGPQQPQLSEVADALAAYVRSLSRGRNRYEAFIVGDEQALSTDAQRGLSLFVGAAGCAQCHLLTGQPSPLTDSTFHRPAIAADGAQTIEAAVAKLGQLPPSAAAIAVLAESDAAVSNLGRYVITRNPADIGAFRTPSLRNVALTAPYMHDGSIATLSEAIDREINTRVPVSVDRHVLSERDRQDLVAFLEALTDLPPDSAAAAPFESFWIDY